MIKDILNEIYLTKTYFATVIQKIPMSFILVTIIALEFP